MPSAGTSNLSEHSHLSECTNLNERSKLTCRACAKPARVRILTGYADSQPIVETYCLACAQAAASPRVTIRTDGSFALLAAHIGLALGVLGAFSDWFLVNSGAGFGFQQQLGIALGVISFTLGVMLRIDLFVIAGMLIFTVAAGADLIDGKPGFGWRQEMIMKGGLGIVALSLIAHFFEQRIRKARQARGAAPPKTEVPA